MIAAVRRTGSLFAAVLALLVGLTLASAGPAGAAPMYSKMENRERPWFSGPVCLNMYAGSQSDYAHGVVEWCSANYVQQQWFAVAVPGAPGYYFLKNARSDKCLEVAGGQHADGRFTMQFTCSTDRPHQHWKFVDTWNGWYEVVNRNSGKCLTNADWKALQYNCDGSHRQQWTRPPL
jgi:Ricin-type beta-trefoil lectin domain-like